LPIITLTETDWAIPAGGQICIVDSIQTMLAHKTIFAMLFAFFVLELSRNAINAFGCCFQTHDFAGWAIHAGSQICLIDSI